MTVHKQKPFAHIFEDAPRYARCVDQGCDHPTCDEEGTYRAPKNRHGEVFWFCLIHVREYNASWNYYKDIPDTAIEDHIRNHIVWERPSWPLNNSYHQSPFLDPFDLDSLKKTMGAKPKESVPKISSVIQEALDVFSMGYPYTIHALKMRYRELVKLYHPDTHRGDMACQEHLQRINESYKILKEAV